MRMHLTGEEIDLLEERLRDAGQRDRLAARLDFPPMETAESMDAWEQFAHLCVGIFERVQLWPTRKKCRTCGLTIWPAEVQKQPTEQEQCSNCTEEAGDGRA